MKTASSDNANTVMKPKAIVNIHFETFDDSSESWDSFIERFSAFLDIQSIPEEQNGKVLISSLSPKLFTLLKSLIAPKALVDKSFNEITQILKKHLNPKPLVIPNRHAFLNRKQHEGESLSSFMAELRSLAVPCCYPDQMLNTMLQDTFLSGLSNKAVLDHLFEEDDADLEKTLNIALATEKAAIGIRNIMGNDKQLGINYVKVNKKHNNSKLDKWQNNKEINFSKKSCMRCGKNNHESKMCRQPERYLRLLQKGRPFTSSLHHSTQK